MKNIEYSCDVCGDIVQSKSPVVQTRKFIGFEFGPKDVIVQVNDYYRSERHICIGCLAGLSKLYNEIKSKYVNEDL